MATRPSPCRNNDNLSGTMDPSWSGGGFSDSSMDYSFNGTHDVNGLVVDGVRVDGSWELAVTVEDIGSEVKVRVRGDLHVGGLMHRISEAVNIKQSWADHAIWWSERNMWLLHNRTTLDQYGVQSDAKLVFRRVHGNLQIVLPSMNVIVLRVSYASRVFSVVRSICTQLNIRHPEELSLSFPVRRNDLRTNNPLPIIRHGTKKCAPLVSIGTARSDMPSGHSPHYTLSPYGTTRGDGTFGAGMNSPYNTLAHGSHSMLRIQSDNSLDKECLDFARFADCAVRVPAKSVFANDWLLKPKNLHQKARMHSGWLDVSRSLMEHGIEPLSQLQEAENAKPPTLYLRFKYYSFYDLNMKYDAVRIHQLFEQARWSLLAGHIDCTEDEMIVFVAYQLQAELQTAQAAAANNGDNMTTNYPTLGGTCSLANYGTLTAPLSPDLGSSRRALSPFSTTGGSMMQLHAPLTPRSMLSMPDCSSTLHRLSSIPNGHTYSQGNGTHEVDEVDELLAELEHSCGVSNDHNSLKSQTQSFDPQFRGSVTLRSLAGKVQDTADSSVIPILEDNMRVFKDKLFGIRRYKVYWTVVCEARLYLYKSRKENTIPLFDFSLRDCSVTPDMNVANQRFIIKLSLLTGPFSPSSPALLHPGNHNASISSASLNPVGTGSREEIWIRCESGESYAKWVAAFRLGSRGKTLASRAAYEKEVEATMEILRLQMSNPTPVISPSEAVTYLGDLTDFSTERIIKKARSKEALRQRICEVLSSVCDLSLMEAKMKYIQAWQRLTHYGRTYFIVYFDKTPNTSTTQLTTGVFGEHIIAICQGRVELVNSTTAEILRAWNFTDMRSWNINWDAGRVDLEFRNGQISFKPLSANCKTVVEFIGGYVFLSQRTPDKNQELNERLFHRLTGVSD